MATTTREHGGGEPARGRLIDHLGSLRSRVLARVLGRGALASLAWLSLAAAVAILVQGVFGPRLWLGLVLCVLLLVFAAWVVGTRFVDPLRRYPILRRFAWVVDREVLGGGDRVVGAFDLARQRERERDPLTRSLIDHTVAERLPVLEAVRPGVLDRGPKVLPLLGMLLLAGAILGTFHLASPLRLRAAWLALLHPTTFPYSPGVDIDVMPGDLTVDTGSDVRVTVQVTGNTETPRLLYRKEGGPWKSAGMATLEAGEISWMGQLDGSQVTVEQRVPRMTYRASLPDLRVDTAYRIRAGRDETGEYAISVTTPPRVTEYAITSRPPDYTGLPEETVRAPVGTVAALLGSRVTVAPVVEGRAENVEVVRDDERVEEIAPDVYDRRTFSFEVGERFEYRVRLSDTSGRVRFESPSFAVDPLVDRAPLVQVVRPGDDTEVAESLELDIAVSCADDFGLTKLVMHLQKEPHDPFEQEIRSFEPRTRESTVEFDWDLSSLELLPGESVTYWFELFDNDTVSGPKSARTPIYEVRFPSMAELYTEAEAEYAESVVDAVKDIFEREKELTDRLETLRQDVERSREGVTWERRKEVESLIEGAESLQEQLSQAMESMQRSMDRMGESDMMSYEILERMEMIQELLEDVHDERLQAMMEEVRKALEAMDQRQLQEALERFEFTQEDVLQSLDRAVEHLEQILAEQKLDAALDELQALLDEQADINEELEGDETGEPSDQEEAAGGSEGEDPESGGEEAEGSEGGSEGEEAEGSEEGGSEGENAEGDLARSDEASSGVESEPSDPGSESAQSPSAESSDAMSPEELAAMAERQDQLREQLDELGTSLEEIEEMASESHPTMSQQLQQSSSRKNMSSAGESMESASDAMRQPNQTEALRYGLSAQEQLQMMMNGLMGASQSMQAQRNAEAAAEMLALGADLLHLSNKQETVVTARDGTTTREMAADEMRLFDAAGRASEKLHEIGKKTLFVSQSMLRDLGAVLDDMNAATTHFEAGNRSRGGRNAHDAMSGLNDAVMDLLRAQQQMQQAGGACSNPQPNAMSRIPALSGMQQQVNQQSLSLRQQLGSGRLTPGTGQEALRQLAARQEAIRRGVQEIAGELAGRRDVLGRLDEMGDDLEELVEEMNEGRLDGEVIKRQQKILSRLLAAERSIRKQDQEDERLARSAEDHERVSPSAIDEETLGRPEGIEREILQGRTDPFPPRYRRMIEAYFKALGEGDPR